MTHLSTQPILSSEILPSLRIFSLRAMDFAWRSSKASPEIARNCNCRIPNYSQSASSSRCFCSISCGTPNKIYEGFRKDCMVGRCTFQRSSSLVMSFAFSPWQASNHSSLMSNLFFSHLSRFGSIIKNYERLQHRRHNNTANPINPNIQHNERKILKYKS